MLLYIESDLDPKEERMRNTINAFLLVGLMILIVSLHPWPCEGQSLPSMKDAQNCLENMKAEIQQAQRKLDRAKEGDDLSLLTVTTQSVPNMMGQLQSLSKSIKDIQNNTRSSSVSQKLSSGLLKMETIINELNRVSKQNLKSASQDQLNKLSRASEALERDLSEAENRFVQLGIEDLKKTMRGDIEDMKEEVKDAFNRLAKVQEGDDLFEICVTRTNLPNLKRQFDSLSKKVKEAEQSFGSSKEIQTFSSDISKIGNILKAFESVAKDNLKAKSEAQLKKLSDSLVSFQSRIG